MKRLALLAIVAPLLCAQTAVRVDPSPIMTTGFGTNVVAGGGSYPALYAVPFAAISNIYQSCVALF